MPMKRPLSFNTEPSKIQQQQQNPFKKAHIEKKPQRTAEEGSFLYDGEQSSEFGIREDTQLFWQLSFDENLFENLKRTRCGMW